MNEDVGPVDELSHELRYRDGKAAASLALVGQLPKKRLLVKKRLLFTAFTALLSKLSSLHELARHDAN